MSRESIKTGNFCNTRATHSPVRALGAYGNLLQSSADQSVKREARGRGGEESHPAVSPAGARETPADPFRPGGLNQLFSPDHASPPQLSDYTSACTVKGAAWRGPQIRASALHGHLLAAAGQAGFYAHFLPLLESMLRRQVTAEQSHPGSSKVTHPDEPVAGTQPGPHTSSPMIHS